jgi:phosphatidylglycerol---prolipoprotein diacylglyceryl transferase
MIQIPLRPELHPLFEALGYLLGFAAYKQARQMSGDVVNERQRWRVIAAATLGALFGSRLLGVLEQAPRAPILLSRFVTPSGGKTIVGGVLGGWLGVEITKKLSGITTRTGDLFAIPLCIGIAVGRVGCLFAGLADDTYGTPTGLPWGVNFGDGIARHPTQAYEILFVTALALALKLLKERPHENGALFRIFMGAYLTWRLFIDFLKPQPLVHGLNVIQWACIGGLALLIVDRKAPSPNVRPDTNGEYV